MITIPNLEYANALKFCDDVKKDVYMPFEQHIIDFDKVRNCDPFPMLLVSATIRKIIKDNNHATFKAINCNNTYAEYMRFFRACGIDKGEPIHTIKYKNSYICITRWDVSELRNESCKNLERMQETIENRSKNMAKILSQHNVEFGSWLVFVLREMIRNIPEHSKADSIWYCAQYWSTYDLVELAILDEGIGIYNSLCSNYSLKKKINDDYDALKLALQPGISRTFQPGTDTYSDDDWKNSGFGLYMVSQLCVELKGSFIIASGNDAIRLSKQNNSLVEHRFDTNIEGTAIQIRISPSEIYNYKNIASQILKQGEALVRNNEQAIKSASKSSKSIIFDDDFFF